MSEAYLVDNALYWLETHEHNFKSIDFVDLRDGFGKIHGEDPDEPSICDASAMPIVSAAGLWSTQNIPIQDMPHISSS